MTRFLILTDEQEAMLGKLFTGHTRSELILDQNVRCETCKHWSTTEFRGDDWGDCVYSGLDTTIDGDMIQTYKTHACSMWEKL